ncbi:response regulator transcription factor [Ruminococcaceae bacterium OttesenSCG-928-A16]|nr:response regulator transcription factor [Ruminococcaceae bacterium OttesenSCG-928-A16]
MDIYLVEDDENIRELVLYTLRASGYTAKGFSEAAPFWQQIKQQLPALVLLDIMLPGEDGLSILKKLRTGENTKTLPVMMLTAKSAEYDKVLGLDTGADDYLAKPFGMMEMVSRVKALLRRTAQTQPAARANLVAGGIVLNPQKHAVTVNGQAVELTLKEFELLKTMLQNVGVVHTRGQLLSQIWGYEFEGESRTVDVHVRSLRQKLGPCGPLVETVRGVGYRIGEQR